MEQPWRGKIFVMNPERHMIRRKCAANRILSMLSPSQTFSAPNGDISPILNLGDEALTLLTFGQPKGKKSYLWGYLGGVAVIALPRASA